MNPIRPIGETSLFGKQAPTYHRKLTGSLNGNGGDDDVFRFRVVTSNTSSGSTASDHFKLPLEATGTFDFVVDWGDGSDDEISAWDDAAADHEYDTASTYDITITGQCDGWRFGNSLDRLKFVRVDNWGLMKPNSVDTFWGCANMVVTASDSLDVSETLNMRGMFRGCTLFNQPIGDWDVSATNLMTRMFAESGFNQPIGDWDVSSVTDMGGMFQNSPFNQPIDDWDVSTCTGFSSMFTVSDFNQPLNSWTINSGAGNVSNMFASTDFNQDLSSWDMSNTTIFTAMFSSSAMNNSLDDWDVGEATSLSAMFSFSDYNQPLNSWRPVKCTNFTSIFDTSDFNQPLDGWVLNTTGTVTLANMFDTCPFDQDISGWDTSNVTSMYFMFYNNTAFDQDISGWDTGNVTTFGHMFRSATIDPDVSGWDISSLTNADGMFLSGNQSQTEYDKLLIGWEGGTHNTGVPFRTNAQFTGGGAAETAKDALVAESWTIIDLGAN